MSDLTNKRKEKISAFLDNDMHQDELMSFSLSAEEADAKTAQRYHMIGDALRGELGDSSFVDISQAVREALADEAPLPVPQATAAVTRAGAGENATANTVAGISGWLSLTWFKPVAGMMVASFVAVVMVFSLSENNSSEPVPLAKQSEPTPAVQLAIEKKAGEKNPHVNKYLVDQHLEFATQDALQGRLPYVRAVSFEAKDKPVR